MEGKFLLEGTPQTMEGDILCVSRSRGGLHAPHFEYRQLQAFKAAKHIRTHRDTQLYSTGVRLGYKPAKYRHPLPAAARSASIDG